MGEQTICICRLSATNTGTSGKEKRKKMYIYNLIKQQTKIRNLAVLK